MDRERHGCRRGDRVRPVGAGHREPQPLTRGRAGRRRRRARATTSYDLPGQQRRSACGPSRKARSSVAAGDQRRGAVVEDVAELDRQRRRRRRGADPQPHPRLAHDRLRRRRPLPGQRAGVVLALVAGQPPRQVAGAVDPGGRADVGLDVQGAGALEHANVAGGAVAARQAQPPHSHVRREPSTPRAGRGPARAGSRSARRRRRRSSCSPPTPQPAVEPRHHLGVEVDARPGIAVGGVGVRPRPGQQPVGHAGAPQRLDGAEGVVAVAVGPAGDEHHRALDPLVAAVPSARRTDPCRQYGPSPVLPQPGQHPGLVRLQPPPPLARASPGPTPPARAAARSSASCSGSSRRGRAASARPPRQCTSSLHRSSLA